jgi:predicted acetyltransferase
MSRSRWYIDRGLEDVMSGTKPTFVAVHVDPTGTMDGYVKYAIAWDESENDDVGRGMVHDLFGVDASVERDLWAYLLGIDLIDEWRSEERPIDEAIRFALADMRAHRVRDVWDEQWLRLLDVDAALRARTYRPCERSVVIGVSDPWFSDNVGAWRVEPSGAKPTDAAPDLEVPIDILSAAYLGGTSWRELADAGQVAVHRADAVDDADSLFTEFPAPFCGTFY